VAVTHIVTLTSRVVNTGLKAVGFLRCPRNRSEVSSLMVDSYDDLLNDDDDDGNRTNSFFE